MNDGDDPVNVTSSLSDTATSTGRVYVYAGAAGLKAFHDWYLDWHGYIAVVVCAFGIVANALNIVVLTRRNMISATNCILTGLAVSDGLTMAAYLPFALRFYVLYGTESTPERNSLEATKFMLFYACFSVVVHTVSIWLTVTLAVFRYVFIKYPRYGAEWCSLHRAKLAIVLVNVVTLIVCIPNFITITVRSQPPDNTPSAQSLPLEPLPSSPPPATANLIKPSYFDEVTESLTTSMSPGALIWNVEFKEDTTMDVRLKNFNFWIQAILVKLVPCAGLTILSVLLVRTMKKAEKRRLKLRAKNNPASNSALSCAGGAGGGTSALSKEATLQYDGCSTSNAGGGNVSKTAGTVSDGRNQKTNRTTRMLLVVVALFVLTELPQGIINLLSGVLDPAFVSEVYMALGDLLDVIALVNNGINFILYCAMSKQFRDTFISVVWVAPSGGGLACCRGKEAGGSGGTGGNRNGVRFEPVSQCGTGRTLTTH